MFSCVLCDCDTAHGRQCLAVCCVIVILLMDGNV